MLYKENLRPAYAAAGVDGAYKNSRSKTDSFAFSDASDDFGGFGGDSAGTSAKTTRTSPPPKPKQPRQPRGGSGIPTKTILLCVVAVVALVAVILLLVAIFSAPKKNIVAEDNAYFVFADAEGKKHIVSNGKVIKQTFEGEVELVPAADSSFAYVCETITTDSGTKEKVYILNGKKLEDIQVEANEILAFSALEPGVLYKRSINNTERVWCYSGKDVSNIVSNNVNPSNFYFSADSSTVVYTVDSTQNPENTVLMYCQNGNSTQIGPENFIPVGISIDGRYVYGIKQADETLHYLDVKNPDKVSNPIAITTAEHGIYKGIAGINVDGDEMVFYTETATGYTSYLYRKSDSAPTLLAQGIFVPVASDNETVYRDTFINSCFECDVELVNEDGTTTNTTATYYLDKDGARIIAETTGQFSPDGKYFYYKNEYDSLLRVALTSKDFEGDAVSITSDVSDFKVVEKGDVYIMIDEGAKIGIISYWKASTKTKITISLYALLDSMELCSNSIYFAEVDNEQTTIYVSTAGSDKQKASFDDALTETPEMATGLGEKGYAYYTDANGVTKLFYTSNGEKFSLVATSCVIEGQANTSKPTEKPTEATDEEEEE